MSLLADLGRSLARGRSVLLIRHAARSTAERPTAGTPLTPLGRAAATQLGIAVSDLLRPKDGVIITHSPVLRCAQTSAALSEGFNRSGASCRLIGERAFLGPSYLRDPLRALDAARHLGPGFVRHWFDGLVPSEWIESIGKTARYQVSAAIAELHKEREPRLAILVSHDWNLMAVREYFFGIRHEDDGWIDFLDGIILRPTTTGITLSCRSMTISTTNRPCHELE